MQTTEIKNLTKLKEKYFMRHLNGKTVYLVNHYDRNSKKYSVSPVNDMNKELFISASKKVFICFTY